MGLNNYTFTKHADQRLMERFLISKNNRQSFITNFMTTGGKFERKEGANDIWSNGDIFVVVAPETQTIITVYHRYQKDIVSEPLEPTLMADLAAEARKLRKRKVRDASGGIQNDIEELLNLSRSLGNTHDEVVDEAFDSLYNATVDFKKKLGTIRAYRQDADKLIER